MQIKLSAQKALVIGYGSIGARHARILSGMGVQVSLLSSQPTVRGYPLYKTLQQAMAENEYDYVVIANRTADHHQTLLACKKSGFSGKILVEKPLFAHLPETEHIDGQGVYVAYNLRFHPLVSKLKKILGNSKIWTIHIYVGQYLPHWRPDQDYRRSYSASKAQGGGVLRDLSHEFDYLCWLSGPWREISALGGKVSDLEIDSEDAVSVLISTEKCPVASIHMNYLDRQSRREIFIQHQGGTVKADLVKNTLNINGKVETVSVERDETYMKQHEAILGGEDSEVCTFEEGKAVVGLIDTVEKALQEKSWQNSR